MNEFIVWDKWCGGFCTNSMTVLLDIPSKVHKIELGDRYVKHDLIKTDIEGNKIYADCSIVEFEWYMNGSSSSNREIIKLNGYFTYDNHSLKYRIKILDIDSLREFINYDYKVAYLKVIGTLQENKELLD
jgi:hypothetical protein